MSECKHKQATGECNPGLAYFEPIGFVEHFAQAPDDDIPYAWKMRTIKDIPPAGPGLLPRSQAGDVDEWWVCEDCHLRWCKMVPGGPIPVKQHKKIP